MSLAVFINFTLENVFVGPIKTIDIFTIYKYLVVWIREDFFSNSLKLSTNINSDEPHIFVSAFRNILKHFNYMF